MRGKHPFFIHSGTAYVALPCTWLVPMTCCSYGIQDSKESHRNSLFPEAWRMVFSRNRAPVLARYFVPMGTANCWAHLKFGSSGLIFKQKTFFVGTFTAAFAGFPKFFCEGTARPNQRNKENYEKSNCSLSSANAPEIFSYFAAGANTKPLGASAWTLNDK